MNGRKKKALAVAIAVAVAGATASFAWPRQAKADGFDCFATVIGCGEAWIKTCNCGPQ